MNALCRSFSTLKVKGPLHFKAPVNRWRPSGREAEILRAISDEFRSRFIHRAGQESSSRLASCLAYALSPKDIQAALGTGGEQEIPGEMRQLLSLELANQKQLNQFNVTQAIQSFGRRPNDTGSPEVQAAILTVKVGYLMKHKETHKHDYSAGRLIVQLVHERKRHLKYLRRLSFPRYFDLLDKLGLPHDYLESFDNPYLYRYRASKVSAGPEARSRAR